MDAVVQQLENNHRQGKFILLFAHILAGLGHSFGINIFLADKFRRKPRLLALNRKPSQSNMATVIVFCK